MWIGKKALLKILKIGGQMVGKVSINVDITAIYKLAAGTTFKLEMLLNQRF